MRHVHVKFDNYYWIYQLECIPTNKFYTGQTGKPNPCWRWSDHFCELRRGISHSPLLQAEWNLYPDLKYWRFSTVDRVIGKRVANHREAEAVLGTSAHQRLNCLSTTAISFERRTRILSMLEAGRPYKEISAETGISGGMISRINTYRKANKDEIYNSQRREDRRVLHDQR